MKISNAKDIEILIGHMYRTLENTYPKLYSSVYINPLSAYFEQKRFELGIDFPCAECKLECIYSSRAWKVSAITNRSTESLNKEVEEIRIICQKILNGGNSGMSENLIRVMAPELGDKLILKEKEDPTESVEAVIIRDNDEYALLDAAANEVMTDWGYDIGEALRLASDDYRIYMEAKDED